MPPARQLCGQETRGEVFEHSLKERGKGCIALCGLGLAFLLHSREPRVFRMHRDPPNRVHAFISLSWELTND